jgi:hypothetical protein
VLLFLTITHLIGLHNNVLSNYNRYQRTEANYKEQGIDIVEALEKPSENQINGNARISNNPLKDDFIELAISIQNLKPQNVVSNTLEYLVFVFCTFIYGIYACNIASYDFKYKTYKNQALQFAQSALLVGKLLSIIFVMFITMSIILLVAFCGSFFIHSLIVNQIPVETYTIDIFNYETGIILQLLFSFLVILFYIIMGFSLGWIFKSSFIPSVGLLLYGFIIPILGAYDFRNIFSYFSHKVFTFTARFVMFNPKPIDESFAIILILTICTLFITLILFLSTKRSSYT